MKENSEVSGRVVIITGGGQGIGRVYAQRFAEAGAIPIIADVNEETALNVKNEITAAGGRAEAIVTDVADEASVGNLIKTTLSKHGGIDVLINNAAIFSTLQRRAFDQIPLAEWERVMRVNVTGPFLCASAVVPAMREKGWGRIINISSNTVALGRPNFLHYVTSKSALIGMTRSMARELGPDGITVNAIMPSLTRTEVEFAAVTPEAFQSLIEKQCINRTALPDDLVGTLLFLASPASDFLTGQTLAVDGGAVHL